MPARPSTRCWRSAPCPSSTRTTRWRPREIRYGDNDRLSARVASMMSADCLVLLSDIDGLYTAPPGSGGAARRLDEVRQITPEIEAMAGGAGTELSRGGMVTKIEAGKIALASGTTWSSPRARCMHPLRALGEGARLHLVPGAVRSGDRAQALDRRASSSPRAIVVDRCGRREGAAVRQEPAAGRRDARGGRLRARRRRGHPRRRRPRARPRPRRLCTRRRGAHHRQEERRDRRHPGLSRAATSWSIATTWCCSRT